MGEPVRVSAGEGGFWRARRPFNRAARAIKPTEIGDGIGRRDDRKPIVAKDESQIIKPPHAGKGLGIPKKFEPCYRHP